MTESGSALLEKDIASAKSKREESGPPKEDSRSWLAGMSNEFGKRGSVVIGPQREVKKGNVDYTATIRNEMEYLAATRELDVSSETVRHLQGYVDRMLEGEDTEPVRVVLMKKGEAPEAFVMPDGTVFINQSLINALDSVDEVVGGVLAHELGHVINKTFDYKTEAGGSIRQFGVCWAHETGSDLVAPRLAEKIGLRSTGIASAIQKISANQRGVAHQTGEMRGATVMGEHGAMHFATSDVPETPMPPQWKTASVEATNLELVQHTLKEQREAAALGRQAVDTETFRTMFSRLSIQDFATIYPTLHETETLEVFKQLATERLTAAKYSEADIVHFFIQSQSSRFESNMRLVDTPEELVDRAQELSSLEYSTEFDEMHRLLFDQAGDLPQPTTGFLIYVHKNFVVPGFEFDPTRVGVPITEDALIQTLAAAQNVPFSKDTEMAARQRIITKIMCSYLNKRYLQSERFIQQPPDVAAIKRVVDKVQEAGITLNTQLYNHEIRDRYPQLALDLFPDEQGMPDLDNRLTRLFFELRAYNPDFPHPDVPLNDFLNETEKLFRNKRMNDSQRKEYVNKIIDRFSQERGEYASDEKMLRTARRQFKVAVALYTQDKEEFYETVQNIMQTTDLEVNELSWQKLFDVCGSLLRPPQGACKIKDFTRLTQLSYLKELQKKKETAVAPTNIKDLLSYTKKIKEDYSSLLGSNIFSDNLAALIVFPEVRKSFMTILENDLSVQDTAALYTFIKEYLPSDPTTKQVLSRIARERLNSEATLPDKIVFLRSNFEAIGMEGLVLLADQIHTMDEYQLLHDALGEQINDYLRPNNTTTVLAGADNASTGFVRNFKAMLSTASADERTQKRASTKFAEAWFREVMMDITYNTSYDAQTNRFGIADNKKKTFRSVQDIFDTLQGLSESQKAGLIMKVLLDQDGALTTENNRVDLGLLTVDALAIEDSFIRNVLKNACNVADAKVVGYPLAAIFSPLLFRALDTGQINMDSVMQVSRLLREGEKVGEIMSEEQARQILTSPTRKIVTFGKEFVSHPDTLAAKLNTSTQDAYFATYDILDRIFPEEQSAKPEQTSDLDPGTEAVIQGIQASGAVGVRSLQIARQLRSFSEPVEARLAQTFDSNPGLNKLLFWENLYKFRSKTEGENERYAEAGRFVQERIISIGEKLGGGSLYTTYAAVVKGEDGQPIDSVVKMLNPNAALVIESFYTLALDTLEKVKEKGTPAEIAEAKQSLMLVELAQQWCLADINDPNFEKDDDAFRVMLDDFNQRRAAAPVTAPERIFTNYLLKAEHRAKGSTLNAVLQNTEIPLGKKQEAVKTAIDLFEYEMKQPRQGKGKKAAYMMRSDPNPGNFMVQTEGEQVTVAILDRNLFLHLNEAEAAAIRHLWYDQKEAFFRGFMQSIFTENKTSFVRKPILGLQLKSVVEGEISKAGGIDAIDPLNLMQVVMGALDAKDLQIPLRMHLAIKNVAALKELQRRYILAA
jgi:hypothetical protein